MSIIDDLRKDEARVLDRLVDGELSQAERRELLAALDDEPGAWRRAALAFIEAQSWRWQLSRMATEPIIAQAASRAPAAARPALLTSSTIWGACLAVAGSLLVAFGLGTRFPSPGLPQVATVAPDAREADQPETTAVDAGSSGGAVPVDTGGASASDDPSGATIAPTEPAPWETLTLALGGEVAEADPLNNIQVRARSSDLDDADWLAGSQSSLPAALVEQLEQDGWNVTRERHLLPVSLSDGRRMVVPVEQVDIRPPEQTSF